MVPPDERVFKQYELMVSSARDVTGWRQTANGFYLSVSTALVAVATFIRVDTPITSLMIGAAGLLVSILWFKAIKYYRILNQSKFSVISDLEKELPMAAFTIEGKRFADSGCSSATQVEMYVPCVFAVMDVVALILAAAEMLIQA